MDNFGFMGVATQTVNSAKQFLLNRLSDASQDDVALSDIEKRMFVFSEMAPEPGWEANEKFDAECDSNEYELKITKLLRRAYADDKKTPDSRTLWRDCLEALRKEDFYGLVMIDQAKIPRPVDYTAWLDPQFIVFTVLELTVLGLAFEVLADPLHWRLPSEGLRLLLFVFFIVVAWLLGDGYRRLQNNRVEQRQKRTASRG